MNRTGEATVETILCGRQGRMGNQLLAFAHFLGWALDNGATVSNATFWRYCPFFEISRGTLLAHIDPLRGTATGFTPRLEQGFRQFLHQHRPALVSTLEACVERCGESPSLAELRKALFQYTLTLVEHPEARAAYPHAGFFFTDRKGDTVQELEELAPGFTELNFFDGWGFRYRAGFISHRETIKQILRPLAAYRRNADGLIQQLRQGHDRVIGVHVRRDDYRDFKGGQWYYGDDVFLRLMRECEALYANEKVAFVLCSDEPLQLEAFAGLSVFRGPGHMMEDLLSLAGADLIIGPPSTFSTWASYQGDTPRFFIRSRDAHVDPQAFKVTGMPAPTAA